MQRWLALALLCLPGLAWGSEIDARQLSALWGLPFAGLLLCIALCPLFTPHFWHRHFGKVAVGWALAVLLPLLLVQGWAASSGALAHVLLAEYLPFVILLVALYTASGGIYIRGNLHGSPGLNTGLLALGALLASVMGTTGASMLLIRPLIRANDNRRHVAHVVVFFIFIVSNVGGALTPLGDPPLFLGFLQGVGFFWTVQHLAAEMLFVLACLLGLFYAIDRHWYRKEGCTPRNVGGRRNGSCKTAAAIHFSPAFCPIATAMGLQIRQKLPSLWPPFATPPSAAHAPSDPTPDTPRFGLDGAINLLPLAGVVVLVLLSGTWKPALGWQLAGVELGLPGLVRDAGLLAMTALSLWLTPAGVRQANQFSWGPMAEVAKLFLGIFITMLPVLALLKLGAAGPFSAVVQAVSGPDGEPVPAAYFWLTGALSSFLDNAPTYLVFFNLAGGDAATLMGPQALTLTAISAGAVFMGANSYIGNAPNFMVKAIAEERGIRMPSFFGYMAWSGAILLPIFGLVTWIFF